MCTANVEYSSWLPVDIEVQNVAAGHYPRKQSPRVGSIAEGHYISGRRASMISIQGVQRFGNSLQVKRQLELSQSFEFPLT